VEDWLLGPPFAAGDLKRDAQCVENVVTMLAQAAAEAAKEISPAAAVAGATGAALIAMVGRLTLGTSGQTV